MAQQRDHNLIQGGQYESTEVHMDLLRGMQSIQAKTIFDLGTGMGRGRREGTMKRFVLLEKCAMGYTLTTLIAFETVEEAKDKAKKEAQLQPGKEFFIAEVIAVTKGVLVVTTDQTGG